MPLDHLNSILTRYQNHVGAYDKAKWEQSIEERILHGISHISTKSAKLGNDLIDLDLVQGSSFPKAKPKHGLFTVTRHALLRFIFLPFYHEWWASQTSINLYIIFILLYGAQVFNLALYLTQPTPVPSTISNVTVVPFGPENEPGPPSSQVGPVPVQTSDILSPIVLMFILTILHSQIVSTHWSTSRRHHTPPPTGTNSRSPRRDPKVKPRNSLTGKSSRKLRRPKGRLPPSRRRNNSNLPPISFVLGPPLEYEQQSHHQLAPPQRPSISSSSLSPSTSKKVLFLEESATPNTKSISPSNSDKDEGIPEEIGHEPEDVHDEDDCRFGPNNNVMSIIKCHDVVTDPIIQKNLVHTVSQYVEEQNRCLGMTNGDATMVHGETNATSSSLATATVATALRKRNFSKQSVSTTTPSASGGECSSGTDEEDDDLEEEEADDQMSEEAPRQANGLDDEDEVRKSEWTAVTTNSEDDDYLEEEANYSEDDDEPSEAQMNEDPFAWEFLKHLGKTISPSDKVSCTIWESQEAKKADLTVLDISALIIAKVERAKENSDYLYLGILFSVMLAILPACWRLSTVNFEMDDFDIFKTSQYVVDAVTVACGDDLRTRVMLVISGIERLALALCVFFLLAVAEKTYKQRFLYSKLFSRITSTRKSRKSNIPHFRLNKVRNIKTWLSIRSYLQRRGPQRSVDTIVSSTFIATLILICFISVELLKESSRLYYLYNLEVIGWTFCLGIYLMRFMTLGSRISQKYRNLSVIITEQLNLYLKMEQKPHKKEELLVANNVLKLASELLKELEDPFKISSFASNPYFYNVTRLVILSAFSGVISELLGFKLKLYKIKLK